MTTRRRGAELENAILDAGWRHLLEYGYSGLTFEAVAERAKTGKAALYRRWPDKETLLIAVLSHNYLGTPAKPADTGSLRDDVLAHLHAANQRLSAAAPAVLSAILGAYFDDTKAAPSQLRARLLTDRPHSMAQIIQRAVERGELRHSVPDRVSNLPFDLLRHEMIMNLEPVPDDIIVDIVDTVFLPLALTHGNADSTV